MNALDGSYATLRTPQNGYMHQCCYIFYNFNQRAENCKQINRRAKKIWNWPYHNYYCELHTDAIKQRINAMDWQTHNIVFHLIQNRAE